MVESGMDNATKYGFIKRYMGVIYRKNSVTGMVQNNHDRWMLIFFRGNVQKVVTETETLNDNLYYQRNIVNRVANNGTIDRDKRVLCDQ